MVYEETISIFSMKLPTSFDGMVTMKNKFHLKDTLLETKIFLSTAVYTLNNASILSRSRQKFSQSNEKLPYN